MNTRGAYLGPPHRSIATHIPTGRYQAEVPAHAWNAVDDQSRSKKSAEKIVQGLKDKIAPRGEETEHTEDSDVVDALLALGYSHEEARRALRETPKIITSTKDRIREALKILGT